MNLGQRARMRPVLYPAAILVALVLNFLVATGVSPYAAGRPLIVAVGIGLLLPGWLGWQSPIAIVPACSGRSWS